MSFRLVEESRVLTHTNAPPSRSYTISKPNASGPVRRSIFQRSVGNQLLEEAFSRPFRTGHLQGAKHALPRRHQVRRNGQAWLVRVLRFLAQTPEYRDGEHYYIYKLAVFAHLRTRPTSWRLRVTFELRAETANEAEEILGEAVTAFEPAPGDFALVAGGQRCHDVCR